MFQQKSKMRQNWTPVKDGERESKIILLRLPVLEIDGKDHFGDNK